MANRAKKQSSDLPRIFLIDAHALCYRSFYAIRHLANSRGEPTNAVLGFVNTLRKILNEFQPKYCAVCFDSKEKTHREELFEQYKIHRQPMPEELIPQIGMIKDVIRGFNIELFENPGFEADDIIATLADRYSNQNVDVVIASGDKDLYQCAGKRVSFYSFNSGEILDEKAIREKFGFEAGHIIDFIGLAGDNVDNIPGVKGIGKVTATKLINEFGDLENLYKNIDRVTPPGVKSKLIDQKDTAILSKELAILDRNVPVELELKDCLVQPPNREELHRLFSRLEFRRLMQEFAETMPDRKPSVIRTLTDKDQSEFKQQWKKSKVVALIVQDRDGLFESGSIVSLDGETAYQLKSADDQIFQDLLNDEKLTKVVYDLKFLLKRIPEGTLTQGAPIFDMKLAAYLLNPVRTRDQLLDVLWSHLNISGQELNVGETVCAMVQAFAVMKEKLESCRLFELLNDLEIPLSFVLHEMEMAGIALDKPLLKKMSKACDAKIAALELQLYEIAGEKFNLNSPKQLGRIMFEKMRMPVIKKTKTGFSTDESVLTVLAEDHQLPQLLLEYRQVTKLKSTYIDALPKLVDPVTKRLHTQFDQTGAETGRLSSSQPNLQNIPIRTELGREIRRAIIASSPSNLLVAVDYSQIELRILAHLSQDKSLMKAFRSGEDIHTFTATLIFDVKPEEVTSDMRYATKRVNFGIIYGMSAFGLAKDLKVSQSEAQEFIDKYFERYPGVKAFMDQCIKQCEKDGYVSTLLNRRRYIPDIKSQNVTVRNFSQRQAINTPVQGSAADLMKLAMIRVSRDIKDRSLSSRMLLTVHDELVFEVPGQEKQDLIALAVKGMEQAVKLDVPIKVGVKCGKNWLDMQEMAC